jgi:uncharacterized membrane protein
MSDTILVFESAGPLSIAGVVVAMAVACFLAWLGLRGTASRRRRIFLIVVRGVALLLVGMLLLEPALQHRKLKPLRRRMALLVDASESMAVAEGENTRVERVSSFLQREERALRQLRDDYSLETYTFSRQLDPASPEELGKRADGGSTDILAALSALGGQSAVRQKDLAAIILVSDGADTEQLKHISPGAALPEAVLNAVESLQTPVNTFSVGGRDNFVDLAISDVAFDDFAFIRNAVEVEVTLQSTGMDDVSIPVALEQGGRNLASKVVTVPAGGSEKTTLRFVPDRVGKFTYRVVVPVMEGESISENNTRSYVARVIRDKIRVLHVVGRPSWDQRFLREVLKRNPNIDLVSFYILRMHLDAPGVSEQELSLIPFPVAQLFGTEIGTFDLVIFQNFNHAPYQVSFFLSQVVEYVRGGGAFLMIGGDLSFGSGGYGLTPLEDILPVRLQAGRDFRVDQFKAVVSPEGSGHPVLDLGEPGVWERLPELEAFNLAAAPVPDAMVLLVHPFERSGSERAPILALREVGRGRVAALLTDGSWRWNFVYAGRGGDTRPYYRFYNNMLRWLIRDPALDPVFLRSRKARYAPDEPVQLKIQAHGVSSSSKAVITLYPGRGKEAIERHSVELDDQGRGEIELKSPGTGAFVVRIQVGDHQAEEAFVVEGTSKERSNPAPRPDLLDKIAKAAGGRSSSVEKGSFAGLNIDSERRYRVEASTTRPLLSSWWVLAGLIGLLVAEWWIRRFWGFS